MPRINTRALIHGYEPPLPYVSIDTLKVAKRQFNFTSNKLDFINKKLGINAKTETNMELWRDCFQGKEEPLKRMESYNINDVRIQEELYLRIRPWIKPHPNVALNILDETQERCPTCGSKELKEVGKTYKTTVNQYELLRCECGATSRRRKGANTIKQNRMILSSVPR